MKLRTKNKCQGSRFQLTRKAAVADIRIHDVIQDENGPATVELLEKYCIVNKQ